MADIQTPSSAAIGTMGASDIKDKSTPAAPTSRPERPDEAEYKTGLAKAEKELKSAEERMKSIKAKLDLARPNNKESPSAKRQQELRSELSSIRTQQQTSKTGRTSILEKVKRLDDNLKSRIAEQKQARGRVQFKSVDEIQKEIDRMQKQVDAGTMKIVDEKKTLADISQLNRQKKSFAGFDEAQKGIDDVKAQIAELKKSLDDPESKALSERYTAITTELDQIRAEQDDVYKNLNGLRDERTKAHEDQQKKYAAVKEIKDKYFQARRAATEYEREARRVREEKRRAENDAYHRGRRQETAKAKLDEASLPAYQDEIRTTQTLINHFDPASAQKQTVTSPGKFAATASRVVDDAGIKGTVLRRKDANEENYFIGGAGKKKKGGRAGTPAATAAASAEGKFNLDLGTLDSLSKVGVDPPSSQSDIPGVVEQLKEKLAFWKSDQKRKTDENVANAQKEIERLEAEATAADAKAGGTTDAARKPAQANQGINGHASASAELAQEKDAAADVSEDLKKVDLEDATAPEGTDA